MTEADVERIPSENDREWSQRQARANRTLLERRHADADERSRVDALEKARSVWRAP